MKDKRREEDRRKKDGSESNCQKEKNIRERKSPIEIDKREFDNFIERTDK